MVKDPKAGTKRSVAKQPDDDAGQCRSETTALKSRTETQPGHAVCRPYSINKRKKPLGVDPYNNIKPMERRAAPSQKRRSLDDMRRLNEEIKTAKIKGTKS